MNYIEKMLQDYCPNGVEWKELGEVCEFKRGQSLTSKKAVAGDVPVISGGQKPAFMHNTPNREGETIVVAGSGAYAGFVSYWDKPIFVSDAFSVDIKNLHEVSVRYVFHFLLNNQQKIYATKSGAGIPHVYGKNIAKFLIPIPPLKIQEEIVQILDKFTEYVTELTAELTAELTDRQKQYSFYRDKLLSFENDVYQVEWKTLGEVAEAITTGSTPRKTQVEYYQNGTIPWLRTNEVKFNNISYVELKVTEKALQETSIRWIPKNSVIIAISGATAGRVAVNKIPLTTNQHCCSIIPNKMLVNYRYVYHWLVTKNKDILDLKQGARGDINMGMIKKFKIPVPSLEIQSRIVQVLDNFDTVCNDLNIGLPKEIEQRQKQYEYFRDKLLTFAAEGVYTDSTVQYSTVQYSTVQTRPD
ncbi:TPA: restriction endonuclease subunit S [Streptococcus suis]